jgi:hypothetical protein
MPRLLLVPEGKIMPLIPGAFFCRKEAKKNTNENITKTTGFSAVV